MSACLLLQDQRTKVFTRSNPLLSPFADQLFIDRSPTTFEGGYSRNSKRCCFAIHRSPGAHYQIGSGDQVGAIERLTRQDDVFAGVALFQFLPLILGSRQEHDAHAGSRLQAIN